jgi:hypothetical protein
MQFVDQPRLQILANKGRTAAQTHILTLRGGKVKGGAAFHGQGRADVVGQHKNGRMVGRIAAQNIGANVVKTFTPKQS